MCIRDSIMTVDFVREMCVLLKNVGQIFFVDHESDAYVVLDTQRLSKRLIGLEFSSRDTLMRGDIQQSDVTKLIEAHERVDVSRL